MTRARPLLQLAAFLALISGLPAGGQPFAVGLVSSDDPALPAPAPRDSALTTAQVEDMVRRAVDLAGGLGAAVADTARLVVVKPNVVMAKPSGSGVVTDARVVRAVALLIHEVAPRARLLIAEGSGGWISPAFQDCVKTTGGWRVADGFEAAGHRATVQELRQRGIDIDCFDLNFDRALKLTPPGGALGPTAEYELAATVLEADAWINCPVAKTHGAKITCCLKNQLGLLPGMIYGWNKSRGTQTHRGIPHAPRIMDETFVDLLALAEPDFNVVDLIAGTEGGAFEGRPKRANLVAAGRDAIATDLVVAQLMGFNPDDFEYADLGWMRGLGPGSIDRVTVRGGRIDELASRYKKASMDYTSEWAEHAAFGMGPRRWTLLGPLPPDHAFSEGDRRRLSPVPGRDGWSPVVRFGDDRIDLDTYFDDPTHCAVYAFTRFAMARSDSVRLWLGSEEDLDVWIDGRLVSRFQGRRRHVLGGSREPAYVEAGEHALLVRAGQTRGRFDFSVNVCEPIDDPFYAGNRYPGVRYYVTLPGRAAESAAQVAAEDIREDWLGETSFESNLDAPDPVIASRSAPDSLLVEGVPAPASRHLVGVAAALSGLGSSSLDSVTAAAMGTAPFHLGFEELEGWYPRYGPDPGRVLGWLGLRYDVRAGARFREALKTIHGWLASGRVPLTGYGDENWFAVTGIRRGPEGVQIRISAADSSFWDGVTQDWWASFPGWRWHNCPVVVVEPTGAPPTTTATLADSMAALALEMGLRPWTSGDPQPWGERRFPAGLAAWDAWVIAWERFPLTLEWLLEEEDRRGDLAELGESGLPQLIRQRSLAATYFGLAAERVAKDRRAAFLQRAATGYRQVVEDLEHLRQALPVRGSGEWTDDDRQRVVGLGAARGDWRQAREGERAALSALAEMLDRPPLPPAGEDPLRRRDRGLQLFSWRAGSSGGVCDLTLRRQDLQCRHLFGRQPEDQAWQVLAAAPREPGWQVAVEALDGDGHYMVLQQPEAANDYATIVRVDDSDTWQNATDLVIWAVPAGQDEPRSGR